MRASRSRSPSILSVLFPVTIAILASGSGLAAGEQGRRVGSRFVYLDEQNPYYPNYAFPKLTTPMWVGEQGVDAVVLLTIDDMGRATPVGSVPGYVKPPDVYQQFLLPLVNRLKKYQGRAPISIFTCQADPADGMLRAFLHEGVSLEVHTTTHPVPLLRTPPGTPAGEQSLELAVRDVFTCLASLNEVPEAHPVCLRVPGCDARNTSSPRLYAEILTRRTAKGGFLTADSSIFMIYTSQDKTIPRALVLDEDGTEHFHNYIKHIRWCPHYVNNVFNYPYPYAINNLIWEFAALVPGDAHGVHVNGYKDPATVATWKRALDVTVLKQGLMTLCFHPHGYIENEQLVELIDYSWKKYGKRVRFLNCRDVYDRLTENVLGGQPLRSPSGADNGVRLLDVNADGWLDAVIGNSACRQTRTWHPATRRWKTTSLPLALVANEDKPVSRSTGVRFFTAARDGRAGLAAANEDVTGVWEFDDGAWKPSSIRLPVEVDGKPLLTAANGIDRGVRFRDLTGDGLSDLIVNNESQNAVFLRTGKPNGWQRAGFALPAKGCLVDQNGIDRGLRFVDLDKDGDEDLILSNDQEYWVQRNDGPDKGWSQRLLSGKAGTPDALPKIVAGGRQNGVWFHSGAMILVNEFTAKQPELMQRRPFDELLKGAP